MAKNLAFPKVLQFIKDLPRLFAHFPSLLVDRIAEVTVDLDDSLHDKLAPSNHIDAFWIESDVVDNAILLEFQL